MTESVSGRAPRSQFQVLSLDGGGVLGIFTAAFLANLERELGSPVIEHFDLVVGTSTGGIIAAALGAGMRAEDIMRAYLDNAGKVFPGPRWFRASRQAVRGKYTGRGRAGRLGEPVG